MSWLLPRAPRPAPLLHLAGARPLTAAAAAGPLLLTGSASGQVTAWRRADGEAVARFQAPGAITALAVLSGEEAVCLAASARGHVTLWTLAGQVLAIHQDHRAAVVGLCVLDGGLLVTCGADHRVHFRDLHTGEVMALPRLHAAPTAAASHEGRLVVCGADGAAQVWSPDGGPPLRFAAHPGAIRCCAVGPDGTLYTAGDDGAVRAWGLDGSPVCTLEGHEGPVRALAVSPDGRRLLSGGDGQRLLAWDLQRRTLTGALDGHDRPITGVAWVPGADEALTVSADRSARVWSCADMPPALPRPMRHTRSVRACVVAGSAVISASRDATVQVWDLPSGTRQHRLDGHTGAVQDLAASADQRRLASVSTDGQIRLWDVALGRLLLHIDDPRGPLACCALQEPGELWVGAVDGSLWRWSLSTGQPTLRRDAHADRVRGCALHPDGKTLATVSYDHTAKLWTLPGATCRATLSGHASAVIKCAFSPDGRWLATGAVDGEIRVWDACTGDAVQVLLGHEEGISGLVFDDDGGLISTAKDGQIRQWAPLTGDCLQQQTLDEPLDAVATWPGGLIAGGVSGTVWVLQEQRNSPIPPT